MLVPNLFVCCFLVPSGFYAHNFNIFENEGIDWGRRLSVSGNFFHVNTRTGTTRFYFSPTGTTEEKPAALDDINWFQVYGFRLNPEELESGAHLVEVLDTVSGEYKPICEDGFNDRTATALCLMSGYDRGYRTTYSVSSSFLHTNLDCFNSTHIHKVSPGRLFVARDSCSAEKYSEDSLPCSKDQAAAVHCFHSSESQGVYHVDIVKTKVQKRSFKIEIALAYMKNGKISAITGKKALKDHRRGTKFTAEACGKEVDTKVRLAKPNKKHFVVEGNVAGSCSTGIDLFHMGNILGNF